MEKLPNKHLDVDLIAFDLDDTLLTKDLTISPKTIAALRKAAEKGIYVVLASGRAGDGILPFVRELDIAGKEAGRFVIAFNGAEVFDMHKRISIYKRQVEQEIIDFVYDEGKKRGIPSQVYDSSTIYASEDNKWTRRDAELCGLKLQIVPDFKNFVRKMACPKMLVPADPEKVQVFQGFLCEKLGSKADIFISKPFFLEIMPPDCGKGQAVNWLAGELHVKNTMAFGDSMNDESMIRLATYGVAMTNGREEIKNQADFVTRFSNNEEGIADFLENWVL